MLQGFSWYLPNDGQHWRRMAKIAPLIAELGFTAVWLPPAYKGQAGSNDVGYGVYDLWDLGEFDQKGTVRTKYGTRKEYVDCIKALQKVGIQVLGDIVLNHKMGGDETETVSAVEVDPNNRNLSYGDPYDITVWSRFTFPGRAGKLDKFTWDAECFSGCDWDQGQQRSAVWRFADKQWAEDVDLSENGDYDYLMGMDVELSNPRVYKQLVKWGSWYLKTTGINGLRLDALKHMSRDFYLRWLNDIRATVDHEVFAVGEYWARDVDSLVAYLGDEHALSLFDVPLHFNFFRASQDGDNIDFRELFTGTLTATDPLRSVTFVENHDTQPSQALASTVSSWFKPTAYACILLREAGYPCIFFADLYGLPNDGIPAVAELPLLMEIRMTCAFGVQNDYLDAPECIGWTREGNEEGSGCAVVLSRQGGSEKHMYVGKHHAGEHWICVLGEERSVDIDDEGWATFPACKTMTTVYLPEESARDLTNIPILIHD